MRKDERGRGCLGERCECYMDGGTNRLDDRRDGFRELGTASRSVSSLGRAWGVDRWPDEDRGWRGRMEG